MLSNTPLKGSLVQIKLDVESWLLDGFLLEELCHDKFAIVMDELPEKHCKRSGRCFLLLIENQNKYDIWYEDALVFL